MRHIGINAQLLSGQAGYRSAGIHGYIYNLLKHLPDADPNLHYTAFVGDGQPPAHERLEVVRSRLPTKRPAARIAWEQLALPGALRRAGVDLHHGMAFSLPVAWNGPSVVFIHDLSFMRFPALFRASNRLYLRRITRLSAKRASRVLVNSQATKGEVVALLGVSPEHVDVTLLGVGGQFKPLPVEETEAFRRRQNLPERFILYVGTLEPRKNLPVLLKAFAALPDKDVGLVLAGGRGWLDGDIHRAIADLRLGERVLLPGYVADEALPLWYNAATLFAYPSLYEGFGMPLLEAMACGTPTLAADSASLPEAVGRDGAGLLVPPDDVAGWTGSLSALLDDESRRNTMRQKGIERAAGFTWQRTARDTVASYMRIFNQDS